MKALRFATVAFCLLMASEWRNTPAAAADPSEARRRGRDAMKEYAQAAAEAARNQGEKIGKSRRGVSGETARGEVAKELDGDKSNPGARAKAFRPVDDLLDEILAENHGNFSPDDQEIWDGLADGYDEAVGGSDVIHLDGSAGLASPFALIGFLWTCWQIVTVVTLFRRRLGWADAKQWPARLRERFRAWLIELLRPVAAMVPPVAAPTPPQTPPATPTPPPAA